MLGLHVAEELRDWQAVEANMQPMHAACDCKPIPAQQASSPRPGPAAPDIKLSIRCSRVCCCNNADAGYGDMLRSELEQGRPQHCCPNIP